MVRLLHQGLVLLLVGVRGRALGANRKGRGVRLLLKMALPTISDLPLLSHLVSHPSVGGVAGKEKGDTGVRPLGAVEAKLPRLVLMPPSSKLEDSPVGGRLSLFQDRWDFFPLGTLGGIHGLEWKWLNTPIASQMGFSSRERRS